MYRVIRSAALSFVACSLLVACGDDSTGVEGDVLTEAEVASLMSALELAGTFEAGGSSEPLDEGQASSTEPCPAGGSVTVTGSVTEGSGGENEVVLDYDVTLQHDGCRVTSEGRTWTLDGSPNVRQAGSFSFVDFFEELTISASLTGGLEWETDGRSGTCALDLDIIASANEAGSSGEVSGTVCGISYTQSLAVG